MILRLSAVPRASLCRTRTSHRPRVSVGLGEDDTATAVATQPESRIVVAGRKSVDDPRVPAYGYDFAVARLLGTPFGGAALSGSIVSATLLGHGRGRVLDVKVHVSRPAKAGLALRDVPGHQKTYRAAVRVPA